MMKFSLVLLGISAVVAPVFSAEPDLSKLPPPSAQKDVTYAKDIKPLFEASCIRCHGDKQHKGGLRLDSLEAVLKGGDDGEVVKPGDSMKSALVIAVAQIDPETAMPPKPRARRARPGAPAPGGANNGTNAPSSAGNHNGASPAPAGAAAPQPAPPKPLTPEQVGLVRAWIDQGAK